MKKRILSSLLVIFVIMAGTTAYAGASKDETVYVLLNNDGSVSQTRVVNHIYGGDVSGEYTDYGRYTGIKSLVSGVGPRVEGERIIWPISLLKGEDLYYEGTIEKELPVHINIKYYLDGERVIPENISGKDGHLKIDITVDFNEAGKKYGLLAQIQLGASLDVFSDIKTQGSRVIVGRMANISFTALPPKEQSFTLEMDGENIWLDPINISLLPAVSVLPKEIKDSMNSLTDGLGEMESGASSLEKGMGKVITGTDELKAGTRKLSGSISKISSSSNEIYIRSGNISSGMEEFRKGLGMLAGVNYEAPEGADSLAFGIGKLSKQSGDIYEGIKELQDGTAQLNSSYKDIQGGLNKIQCEHDKLLQAAALLQDSTDPVVKEMAQGIIEEAKYLEELNRKMEQSSSGLDSLEQNIKSLYNGYGQFDEGLSSVEENIKAISGGPTVFSQAIEEMYNKFGQLEDGTNQLFNGFGEISSAIGAVDDNTKALPGSIDGLINGQKDVQDGIRNLNISGIKKIRSQVKDSMDNSILGINGETYTSFVDNDNNINSTVQFVMRTPGIKKAEIKNTNPSPVEENRNLLQRILDLFR